MIFQNYVIYGSVLFLFFIKIICAFWHWHRIMYKKPTLTSIPENNENEDDQTQKWVPKKKHEVLKAKYKCLKKLFQVYDASVIGILPESYVTGDYLEDEGKSNKRRKKRSHRTKTDACAGTTEVSSGDVSTSEVEKASIANAVMRELKGTQYSCTSTQFDSNTKDLKTSIVPSKVSVTSKDVTVERECECTQTIAQHPIPYLMINEKRRPTRFQFFIQRIFGLNRERPYTNYVLPNGHVYAASDNNIIHSDKRRRRGLRFRRLRRPKKIHSEIMLRDVKSPIILNYVQSVQRNCLMDTTPRQCPIVGCQMMFYGIINYNDHLNLCHFVNRKYICHYCHEGFEREHEKYIHENEHIGLSRIMNTSGPSTTRQSFKIASDTQTDPVITKCDVPNEKIKKIVSFFDKIDPESVLNEMNKSRYSESNLRSKTETTDTGEDTDSDKRTVSCVNLRKRDGKCGSSDSEVTSNNFGSPVICHFCGEHFNYRRQLCLHIDLEHRVHNKFSKFHSCAGLLNTRSNHVDMVAEDGQIKVQSIDRSRCALTTASSTTQDSYSDISRRKSEESLSCDPSTNIVYYTSLESVKRPTNSLERQRRLGNYKWEPGTTIIRV